MAQYRETPGYYQPPNAYETLGQTTQFKCYPPCLCRDMVYTPLSQAEMRMFDSVNAPTHIPIKPLYPTDNSGGVVGPHYRTLGSYNL